MGEDGCHISQEGDEGETLVQCQIQFCGAQDMERGLALSPGFIPVLRSGCHDDLDRTEAKVKVIIELILQLHLGQVLRGGVR